MHACRLQLRMKLVQLQALHTSFERHARQLMRVCSNHSAVRTACVYLYLTTQQSLVNICVWADQSGIIMCGSFQHRYNSALYFAAIPNAHGHQLVETWRFHSFKQSLNVCGWFLGVHMQHKKIFLLQGKY